VTVATGRVTLPASKDEILRAVAAQRRAMLALVRTLEPEQFDTQTALPGWRVREVVGHVISLDVTSINGQILLVAFSSMDRLERWNDRQAAKWAGRPVPDLLLGLERWGRRFVRLGRTLPAPLYRLPVPTIWGRGPGGLLIWSRAYDEWIHRQDIRRALGLQDEQVDLAPVAEFMLTAMIAAVLPQLRGRSGRVAVALEDTPIEEWVFDLGQGTGGAAGQDGWDSRILAPAPAFVMAAAGRDRFEDLLASGTVRVEGDDALGRDFLAATRVV
jgi:uncharacterized protein (TIGR03083 family)